ncbi:unnamed protein product, partial [Amoebophrya sp. A25]
VKNPNDDEEVLEYLRFRSDVRRQLRSSREDLDLSSSKISSFQIEQDEVQGQSENEQNHGTTTSMDRRGAPAEQADDQFLEEIDLNSTSSSGEAKIGEKKQRRFCA